MQPLQQRGPPPRLPLQTPIPAHHVHEFRLLPQMDLRDILQDTLHDDGGDEWRSCFERFSVSTGGFSMLVFVDQVVVGFIGFFSGQGGDSGVLLFFLVNTLVLLYHDGVRATYWKMTLAVTCQ